MTSAEYEQEYWPTIQNAINILLTQCTGQGGHASFEYVYSCVYKCVYKNYSERLYHDLLFEVTIHWEKVNHELEVKAGQVLVKMFDSVLKQFENSLRGLIPLFTYMNRYLESRLDTDLRSELCRAFTSVVVDNHVNRVIGALEEAQLSAFTVPPPTMSSVINRLYSLKKGYATLAPHIFAKYIPNVLPPMSVSELPHAVEETQKLQQNLIERGFTRGDQSKKRSGDSEVLVLGGTSLYPVAVNQRFINKST
ncbi:CDK2-associated and cullin domain-containing protein 1-like [Limulus polyphemus]|uniref:CDK2-associated and cullin domain-containing protein 1-like n=1 Tax=Limulus polyphemus TaxID=6850 RepID=A0ABM1SUQ9_LIMPO|nr:CDK2-associated and cullin domain-containing protein 1-like [Limulus polyphemus]XP_022247365.1 CDK2-associated and cullin domain-containing protein 1-like [Limulus polyphemus]